jgi:uncharacterized protein YjeT (DUF2065 family)
MVRCCNHRFQLLGAETSGNGALDEADAKGGASLLMGAREGTGVMLNHLMPPNGRGRSAKTVEAFGWLVLVEGVLTLFAPRFIASVLHLPPLVDQAASYFRLVGLLACGVGMLYIVSGRLNAEGFVVASLLDRPLVPPAMAALWAWGVVPGPLALLFAVQDFGGFLWTLAAWRAELRDRAEKGG